MDGLKDFDPMERLDAIEGLETLESELETIPEPETNNFRDLDDERQFYYDVSNRLIQSGRAPFSNVIGQMKYIETMARNAMIDKFVDGEPDEEWLQWSTQTEKDENEPMNEEEALLEMPDERDIPMIDNTFGAFPLYYEEDGLDTEFINEIKVATPEELVSLQKMMFPSYDPYYGTERKAELGFLTDKQKSVFWSFVSGRKQQLIGSILDQTDASVKALAKKLFEMENRKQARAIVAAFSRNEPVKVDDDGTIAEAASADEVWMLKEIIKLAEKK
jgi:hypothetical protein